MFRANFDAEIFYVWAFYPFRFVRCKNLKVTMERTEIVATGITQNFINQTESEGYIVHIIQVRAVIRKITYFSSTSFSTHLETRLG